MSNEELQALAITYELAQGGGDYDHQDVALAYQAGARMMLEAIGDHMVQMETNRQISGSEMRHALEPFIDLLP
jgi:hypothetical protein